MWGFIGPSKWQPGGRGTFIQLFFRHLLLCNMGLALVAGCYQFNYNTGDVDGKRDITRNNKQESIVIKNGNFFYYNNFAKHIIR